MNIPQSQDDDTIKGPAPSTERPLQWQAAYECGNAFIDDQHRALFASANALLRASQQGAPEVLSRFNELISHVLGHFADEERVLREVGFAGYAEHRRAHMKLTDQAMNLREAMIHGHHRHEELLEFLLRDVVERHLLLEDRAFFEALRTRDA